MGSLARKIARFHMTYVSYCPTCLKKVPRTYWCKREKIHGAPTMIKSCNKCQQKTRDK